VRCSSQFGCRAYRGFAGAARGWRGRQARGTEAGHAPWRAGARMLDPHIKRPLLCSGPPTALVEAHNIPSKNQKNAWPTPVTDHLLPGKAGIIAQLTSTLPVRNAQGAGKELCCSACSACTAQPQPEKGRTVTKASTLLLPPLAAAASAQRRAAAAAAARAAPAAPPPASW
jgi:hypothetical protein